MMCGELVWKTLSLECKNWAYRPLAEECDAIDRKESAEHFMRILKEYNEWMMWQQQCVCRSF